MICASALLNTNAFPDNVGSEATSAQRRLAVVLRNAAALQGEIDKAATAFFSHLHRNWGPYSAALRQRTDVEYIAYSDGLH